MNSKTPISILQELMVQLNFSLPVYETRATVPPKVGLDFTCTVIAAGICASGCAPNKQQAKQNSAQQALDIINANRQPRIVVHFPPIKTAPKFPAQLFNNFVGELNEYSARMEQKYPVYTEVGLINSQYVITCEISGLTTQGEAPNKKSAKQIAAKKMLDRLKENGRVIIKIAQKPPQATDNEILQEDVEKLLQKVRQFDVNNKNGITKKIKTETITTKYTFDTNGLQSNQQLENELSKSKIKYTIEVFQQHPLILVLKIIGEPYVFLETGTDYDAALNLLLKTALEFLPLLGNPITVQ